MSLLKTRAECLLSLKHVLVVSQMRALGNHIGIIKQTFKKLAQNGILFENRFSIVKPISIFIEHNVGARISQKCRENLHQLFLFILDKLLFENRFWQVPGCTFDVIGNP